MMHPHELEIARIRVPVKRRKTLDADRVAALALDMLENGQTTPIRVRVDGENFVLVEGLHRLEASRSLGETTILAYLVQARLY